MSEMLKDDEVSVERIEALAKQAFIRTDRDKDGDLVLREDGVNTFVQVETDRKMITFFALWSFPSRFNIEEKLQYVNRLNNGKILVRFSVMKQDTLYCDYQFLYEGGINPFNIINTYKRFASVCRGAVRDVENGIADLE